VGGQVLVSYVSIRKELNWYLLSLLKTKHFYDEENFEAFGGE